MTEALDGETVVSLRRGLVSAEIDGDMVLMDVDSGRYVAIGGPGALLTELLTSAPHKVGDLCAAARKRYDIDDGRCSREISDFVRKLSEEGLADIRTTG